MTSCGATDRPLVGLEADDPEDRSGERGMNAVRRTNADLAEHGTVVILAAPWRDRSARHVVLADGA